MSERTLLGAWISPYFSLAAQILRESELDFAYVRVSPFTGESRGASHLAHNPLGKVPALIDGTDATVSESLAIGRYLARAYPSARGFYPSDSAAACARIDTLCDYINFPLAGRSSRGLSSAPTFRSRGGSGPSANPPSPANGRGCSSTGNSAGCWTPVSLHPACWATRPCLRISNCSTSSNTGVRWRGWSVILHLTWRLVMNASTRTLPLGRPRSGCSGNGRQSSRKVGESTSRRWSQASAR